MSIENDKDRLDYLMTKLNNDAERTKRSYDLNHEKYKKERENIGKFREKKEESKNQKLQYFDKQNFIWYNNVFYIILILVSGLFIRNQIKIK